MWLFSRSSATDRPRFARYGYKGIQDEGESDGASPSSSQSSRLLQDQSKPTPEPDPLFEPDFSATMARGRLTGSALRGSIAAVCGVAFLVGNTAFAVLLLGADTL